MTFITRFFNRDKKEVFVSCRLMFNPKLTRGCCWARAASWESFVWELFGKDYEHLPQDQLKNKRLKLHMREFSLADKAIGLFASAGERIPGWNSFPFSRQIFPGDLRYRNQVTFFVSLTSFGDKKTFRVCKLIACERTKRGEEAKEISCAFWPRSAPKRTANVRNFSTAR